MLNSKRRRPGPSFHAAIAVAAGIALGIALLVWARTEITSLRFELGALEREARSLGDDVETLRIEVARLSAPERIEPRARALGMIFPVAGQVVTLRGPAPDVAAGGTR